MKKVVLNIDEMIKAKNAIDSLLSQKGIPFKKAYCLDRNRKWLIPPIKHWFDGPCKEIFEKHAIDVPPVKFIPFTQYVNFKRDLLKAIDEVSGASERKEIQDVFTKYEIVPKGKEVVRGIPIEEREAHKKDLDKAAEEFQKEIVFSKIELDETLEKVLQNIPGEQQVALSFMFEEPSFIKIVPGGPITILGEPSLDS